MSGSAPPELKSGDHVRIDWPNGSTLAGQVHISPNGIMQLRFGPEGDGARLVPLGIDGELHPFVKAGSVQVVGQGTLF